MSATWVVLPFIDCWDYTWKAVEDALDQSVCTRVLLIDQGSGRDANDEARRLADKAKGDVLLWSYNPALPSLSRVWNTALDFVWAVGGTEALVVNNDVRLHKQTVAILRQAQQERDAWFVSAVGVKESQWITTGLPVAYTLAQIDDLIQEGIGGPDFSCFLLAKEGHQRYRFDEEFRPAYHEDLDLHRRYMLGGHGDKIFGVNLPFLHYASRTVNRSPEARAAFHQKFQACRGYYVRKWGPPNAETLWVPFSSDARALSDMPDEYTGTPTTPDLQAYWRAKMQRALDPLAAVLHDALDVTEDPHAEED